MSAILLDGSIVHYEVLGRGRPIIFLHGWVGSWRYWISSMQISSTMFRSYAVDMWGFGDTSHESMRYSLDEQVKLLNRFLEEMGIGRVALIGHGLGALVGLYYTLRMPQTVDRIMAVNCPLGADAINPRMRTSPLADLIDWLSSRTPEAQSALTDAIKADPQALIAPMNAVQADNLVEQVKQMHVPCLFVHGQNDPAITLPSEDLLLRLPLNVHQITLEETGHFPMIDGSARFNRLLTDFLALESGVSPRELQLKEEWKRRVR
jgi:pimeloyl-ACP methyl ester carboxylesterase